MTKSWHSSLALCAAVLLADRLSKAWVMSAGFVDRQVTTWLAFTRTLNRGVSFSVFSFDDTVWFFLVSLFVAVICIWLAYYTFKRWQQGHTIGAELFVLAGAVSNVIDRVWYGGVVDFIELSYTTATGSSWTWPAFNIADCAIVFGLLLMCVKEFYDQKK